MIAGPENTAGQTEPAANTRRDKHLPQRMIIVRQTNVDAIRVLKLVVIVRKPVGAFTAELVWRHSYLTKSVVVADKWVRLAQRLGIEQAVIFQELGCVLEVIALVLAV